MFAANTYDIRLTTEDDADALHRLAELDSREPLTGRVLIGKIAGSPAAALSLSDDRVVADPFRRTDHLVANLRSRAGAIRAYEATPSLVDRLRAALRPRAASPSGAGVRNGDARPCEARTTWTPTSPQPRLRWTHQPATGLTGRWAPAH